MPALTSRAVNRLAGAAKIPGDKSISHRALMIGAIAVGETRIEGLLQSEDVMRTAEALRRMGVASARDADGAWRVSGVGVGGLDAPDDILDMGNSGTSARLLMGLIATHPFEATMTGDASLRRRPMARVARPIERMGAAVRMRDGGLMPLTVSGARMPVPIVYELPVPSAQVKSAVLLAGLNAPGTTTVIESARTRDHTELMLRHFGATVVVSDANAGRAITVTGEPELTARPVRVPGDPSSAAFPAIAALIAPEAEITIASVGMNKLRAGLYDTLAEMGADIRLANQRVEAGEPVADLTIRSGRLKGIRVPAERAPSMIDEYPVLAVAAAFAEGTTRMEGLAELRVKESDRLSAIARGLLSCGVRAEIDGDTLIVHGGKPRGGARIATGLDHRIAMAFLVMGLASAEPVAIDDDAAIATSFPGFVDLMNTLGAKIGAA